MSYVIRAYFPKQALNQHPRGGKLLSLQSDNSKIRKLSLCNPALYLRRFMPAVVIRIHQQQLLRSGHGLSLALTCLEVVVPLSRQYEYYYNIPKAIFYPREGDDTNMELLGC